MSKIRINDLARELEVKSKAILDALTAVGVTEKKTHSSSIEEHEAEKVRGYFKGTGDGHGAAKTTRASSSGPEEIKTKIDLSHISKPGDVLKAIIGKQQAAPPPAPAAPPKPAAPPAQEAKPTAAAPPPTTQRPQPPGPRMIVPQTGPRPVYKAPPIQPGQPIANRPIANRPAPGRPVPGQPIFQRPRPASPGGPAGTRPPLRPGE